MSSPTHGAPSPKNQFDKLFDCFVINLKRQPERLKAFLEQNKPSRVTFNYFEAIDGAQVDSADFHGHVLAKGAINYTSGMIGTAMSHLALWRRCAEQTKYFAVFEDDAVVRADIKTQFASLVNQVHGWDIILLGYNTDVPLELNISPGIDYGGIFSVKYPTANHLSDFANSTNPVGLHRLVMAMGTCGYAVAPKGAQMLIRTCFPMDNRPVGFRCTNAMWRASGIDNMMGAVYRKISAFACVAPLVLTPNDPKTSNTLSTSRIL